MKQEDCAVIENVQVADATYKMSVAVTKTGEIKSGQFLNISTGSSQHLLKRPFAIASHTQDTLTFYYQIKGGGTYELSKKKSGDVLEVLFPLGNGFNLESTDKKIALIGGGAGIFALVSVLGDENRQIDAYFGYQNARKICFENECVLTFTDDGSTGEKGFAVDGFLNSGKKYDAVLACGPVGMLKYLKENIHKNNAPKVLVSLEERMACGIGACLVCTCDKVGGGKARVCSDGPVFNIDEVVL